MAPANIEVLLTTTGTAATVTLPDLYKRVFTHPETDFDLLAEFDLVHLARSDDLQNAIDAGEITLSNQYGLAITNLRNAAIFNASNIADIPIDDDDIADGRYLRYDVSSGTLKYVDVGGFSNIRTDTGTTVTVGNIDSTILCDATSASQTVNLPAATSNNNRIINIKKIDNSANTVTIDGSTSETVDGDLTVIIRKQWVNVQVQCDGTSWFIL